MKALTIRLGLAVMLLGWLGAMREVRGGIAQDSVRTDVVIKEAVFGNGLKSVVVTKRVIELLRTEPEGFIPRNDSLKVDPAPYVNKALVINYEYQGKRCLMIAVPPQRVTYGVLVQNAKQELEKSAVKSL